MKPTWDDYGESSLTIASILIGVTKSHPAVPYDPSDFERCIHLFKCLGYDRYDINLLLEQVAKKYPIWQSFVNNWDGLMECYKEERLLQSAPKLYELLQKCRKQELSEGKKHG